MFHSKKVNKFSNIHPCAPEQYTRCFNANVDVEVRNALCVCSPHRIAAAIDIVYPITLTIYMVRALLYAYYTEIEFPACQTFLTSFLSFDENYISINLYYTKFSVNALRYICLQKPRYIFHHLLFTYTSLTSLLQFRVFVVKTIGW